MEKSKGKDKHKYNCKYVGIQMYIDEANRRTGFNIPIDHLPGRRPNLTEKLQGPAEASSDAGSDSTWAHHSPELFRSPGLSCPVHPPLPASAAPVTVGVQHTWQPSKLGSVRGFILTVLLTRDV